jgi:hypothetical protein
VAGEESRSRGVGGGVALGVAGKSKLLCGRHHCSVGEREREREELEKK